MSVRFRLRGWVAALAVSLSVGAPAFAQTATFEDVLALCETVRKTGTIPQALTRVLKLDRTMDYTSKGVIATDVGKLYVTLVDNPGTTQGVKALVCNIDGARFASGKWQAGVTWQAVAPRVQAFFKANRPKGARTLKSTLHSDDIESIGFHFVECGKPSSFWFAGPSYMSDGGHLFPPSVDWRMEGAVVSISVMRPMFPMWEQQSCR